MCLVLGLPDGGMGGGITEILGGWVSKHHHPPPVGVGHFGVEWVFAKGAGRKNLPFCAFG